MADEPKEIPEESAPPEQAERDAEQDAELEAAAGDVETPDSADVAADEDEADDDLEQFDGPDLLSGLEAQVAELKDKLLRAVAETENVRRRGQREKEDALKYATAGFATDIVSVADNMDRALESVEATARTADPALDNLMTGIEMVKRELLTSFERAGITPIEAHGKPFDHNLHEAMFEIENPDLPPGTVMQVVQGGYMLRERLLRPAKVGVSKGGGKAEPAPELAAQPEETEPTSAEAAGAYGAPPETGGNLDEEL